MKKSYHSKIVPIDEAAITRRMSAALGSCWIALGIAVAIACSPLSPRADELPLGGESGKSVRRRRPREHDRAVAGGKIARRDQRFEPRPFWQAAGAAKPGGERLAGGVDVLDSAAARGSGEDRRRGLADRAGPYPKA